MRMIKAPKKAALRPGSAFYTLEDFEAEHALGDARLWADVLALQGDDGDNVPGVRGVGPKTALRLVQACGGLEGVLARAEAATTSSGGGSGDGGGGGGEGGSGTAGAWPPEGVKLNKKQRAALECAEGRAAARLARELVTVVTDLKQPAAT